MVFSSCVNEDGEEIYPRNWKKMGLVIPKVIKKKQRRQSFTVEVMDHLANSPTIIRTTEDEKHTHLWLDLRYAMPNGFGSASAFTFRWANTPRNHAAQDAIAQDQRVEQHGAKVSEKGQKQEISKYRVGFAQRSV